jgi:hypothetical protein
LGSVECIPDVTTHCIEAGIPDETLIGVQF